MEDTQIIDLFFSRDQQAIQQTEIKYGRLCYHIAWNILSSREDAEESVSDTYMKAWENIPPTKPTFFYAYLAKICRFLAMGKLDWNNAAKRKAEVVELSDEMENCIPDLSREMQIQSQELGALLNEFLGTLSPENRQIFMRRYWFSDSYKDIAEFMGLSEKNISVRLTRIREKMKQYLIEREVFV